MRFSTLSGAALTAASMATAKEMAKDQVKAELYDSGFIHERNMKHKMAGWMAEAEAGKMDSAQWPRLNYTKCIDGKVAAVPGNPLLTFACKNMDLYDFVNFSVLGSPDGWDELGDGNLLTGSGSWGWTDPESGREFAAIGMYEGTALIEISPEGRIVHLGLLPCPAPTNPNALWKEIRGYKNYMIIGSELSGHGIQIFDMAKLLTVDASAGPVVFDIVKDVTGHFKGLPTGQTHNVVVDEENDYIVSVGARPRNGPCKSGLIFIDVKDPSKPTQVGCNGADGYVHDAQCLTYHGPDTKYEGHHICYGYNEDTLTIYDVTDKANSSIISITSYEGAAYTHQGWVLDTEWQEYLLMDDEYDETDGLNPAKDGFPVTYIWDIRSLEAPKNTGIYKGTVRATDHNQYIKNGLSYQSNYGAGFRVYDVSSIPTDPTGDSVCEVCFASHLAQFTMNLFKLTSQLIAFLDIFPEDDDEPGKGSVEMYGTWSSYAMFKSGYVVINTIERGVYIAKMTKQEKCKPKTCNADNCLRALRSTSVSGRLEASQEFCGEFLDGYESDVTAVPEYARKACPTNVISRVSSACSCLPTATPTA